MGERYGCGYLYGSISWKGGLSHNEQFLLSSLAVFSAQSFNCSGLDYTRNALLLHAQEGMTSSFNKSSRSSVSVYYSKLLFSVLVIMLLKFISHLMIGSFPIYQCL